MSFTISSLPAFPGRLSPLLRVLGSAASWFLFALSFTLLFHVTFSVMALGGSCASGGPYEIAVECPDSVAVFAPLSIFGGLIAVGINAFFARGFGTPLTTWAWPILFCGLGGAFLAAFFGTGDPVGLILGVMFELMGLIPLVIEFRGSPQRVFLGQRAATGDQYFEGDRARRTMLSPNSPNPEGALPPTLGGWLAVLVITIGFAVLGYWVAGVWFAAVAG
ncbi:MAG: hypothetical protein KF761_12970 [Salinibacterium sp.]|nr:hypothetical protein [Salinibacterium sp.]